MAILQTDVQRLPNKGYANNDASKHGIANNDVDISDRMTRRIVSSFACSSIASASRSRLHMYMSKRIWVPSMAHIIKRLLIRAIAVLKTMERVIPREHCRSTYI